LRSDIRKLARARRTTLITVTHDLSDAAALADRVLVLAGSPSRIQRDIALGKNPEQELRAYFSNYRDAA
jgi:NitT/TauT family transport system ATP-binding protein